MYKKNKILLLKDGKICGSLGDENKFYNNMKMKKKKMPSLANVINK